MLAAVGAGRDAAFLDERPREVALVVEAADGGDVRDEHARGLEQLARRVDARREDASIAQTVHVSEPGRYRLAFYFLTRYSFASIQWGAEWGSGQNPVRASVVIGGVTNTLGTVTPLAYSTDWQRTEYDVLVPEAGDVRIVLEGHGYNGTADRTTLIDAVSFTKTSGAAGWKPFGDKTKISVAAGGTLSLDYDGTFRAQSFHHAGRSYTGIIDATHESGCIKGAGRIEVLPKGTTIFFR